MHSHSEQFDVLSHNYENTAEKYGIMIKKHEDDLDQMKVDIDSDNVEQADEMEKTRNSVGDMSSSLHTKLENDKRLLEDAFDKKEAAAEERMEVALGKANAELQNHDDILDNAVQTNNNNEGNLDGFIKMIKEEYESLNETITDNDKDDKELQDTVNGCEILVKALDEGFSQNNLSGTLWLGRVSTPQAGLPS